jgi:hypothetical protein
MNKDKKETKEVKHPVSHAKAVEQKKLKASNYPKSYLNRNTVIWKIEKV